MHDFVYKAEYINDEIVVYKFTIIEIKDDNIKALTQNKTIINMTYDIFTTAFSEKDAVSYLINSYTTRIKHIRQTIKTKYYEIETLKNMIPELMFEQRVISNK